MRAGSLDNLVTFLQATVTRDPASNEETKTWVEFGTAYAEIVAKSGNEFFDGAQRHPQTVFHIRCRWEDASGVTEAMMVSDATLGTLSIKAVLPDPRDRKMVMIHAVAGAGAD